MKKQGIFSLLCIYMLCMAVLCTGCAGRDEGEDSGYGEISSDTGNGDSAENNTEGGKESEELSESEAGLNAELTIEELRQFTEFVNQTENNGFLLSQYDSVSGADLNEILYNGAGMESQPLSEEERREYETAAYPVETDITRLTTSQIEAFLQRKAGIGMADMAGGLDWVYLEKSDSYVFQHGDTNYCTFICTGGTRTGETYELRFKSGEDYVSDCITTLKKNGEDYQFVSNRYFQNTDDPNRIRKIEDQSFFTELESWGEVEFVSYAPDILENPMQDVTFRLEREGGEVFDFPEVRSGNLRVNDRFEQIDAVAFKDYDKDGYTDIIIICTYEQTAGEDEGARHQEVRIYKGAEQTFRYMEQLCFTLNVNGKNQSISQVFEEIEEEELDLSGLDANVRKQLEVFAENREQWVPQEYGSTAFGYTVCDMDGDGRLELLVQMTLGTGLFSDNHFYQVDDAGNGIKELPQELYDGYNELDIDVFNSDGQVFRDGDGTVYYMASDIIRNGYAESCRQDGAYWLKDGCVYSMVYRGLLMQAKGEDSWEETCYDAEGNEISPEAWELLQGSFLEGKEEIPRVISWIFAYPSDVRKASEQEILRRLAESLEKVQ